MEIYTAEEAKLKKEEIQSRIVKGQIFIHPTDTIYGIGCNANVSRAVARVRELKQRLDTPFSIMVPSVEWIKENCIMTEQAEKYLKELPGPVTLIIKAKKGAVAPEVAPGKDSLGIRIPLHWFHEIIKELNIPIITTSANISGREFMTSLDNLDPDIKKGIDFVIYEGEKPGRPSKIIDLTKEKIAVKER